MISRYTIVIRLEDIRKFILFNNLFRTAAMVNSELYNKIRRSEKSCTDAKNNFEEIQELEEMGIIQKPGVNEKNVLKRKFHEFQNDFTRMNINILTTENCNLACVYCYEAEYITNAYMDKETAARTVSWIRNRAEYFPTTRMRIVFFGGEPFLNSRIMTFIKEQMENWSRDKNISIIYGAITNGVPMTADRIKKVGNLDFVKVTLDGAESYHNLRRPLRNGGGGSYHVIIENLKNLKKEILIRIGCNIDEGNYHSAAMLPVRLAEIGLKSRISSLRFKPVKWEQQQDAAPLTSCQSGGYTLPEIRMMLNLRKVLKDEGYDVEDEFSLGPCDFFHRNSFTINVNGDISPCGGFPGIREAIIGNVKTTPAESPDIKKIYPVPAQCEECPYFPSCGGGCRYLSYFRTGSVNNISCEMTYFENTAPVILEDLFRKQVA